MSWILKTEKNEFNQQNSWKSLFPRGSPFCKTNGKFQFISPVLQTHTKHKTKHTHTHIKLIVRDVLLRTNRKLFLRNKTPKTTTTTATRQLSCKTRVV